MATVKDILGEKMPKKEIDIHPNFPSDWKRIGRNLAIDELANLETGIEMLEEGEVNKELRKVPHALMLGGKPYEIDWDWEYANFTHAICSKFAVKGEG